MFCEYCNMYSKNKLNNVSHLRKEIKDKYMLNHVEWVCDPCLTKFKSAEHRFIKSLYFNNDNREVKTRIAI